MIVLVDRDDEGVYEIDGENELSMLGERRGQMDEGEFGDRGEETGVGGGLQKGEGLGEIGVEDSGAEEGGEGGGSREVSVGGGAQEREEHVGGAVALHERIHHRRPQLVVHIF